MLSALDEGVQWRGASVSDADVAALPTHVHHPSSSKVRAPAPSFTGRRAALSAKSPGAFTGRVQHMTVTITLHQLCFRSQESWLAITLSAGHHARFPALLPRPLVGGSSVGRAHACCAQGGAGGEASACDDQACSICLEDFAAGEEVKTLPCLHHYHTGCVTRWLRVKGRSVACPVCKTPVFTGQ